MLSFSDSPLIIDFELMHSRKMMKGSLLAIFVSCIKHVKREDKCTSCNDPVPHRSFLG